MKETNTGKVRLVNLACRKCGMSLDLDAANLQAFCPNCGDELLITVKQVMDILDERKEIRQKSVKYIKDVNLAEPKPKKRIDILPVVMFITIVLLVLFVWKMSY